MQPTNMTIVLPMEDELIHTGEHPYCSDGTWYICACSVEVASLVWKDQLSAGRFDTPSPGEGAPSLCSSPGEGDDCRQDSIGVYTQSKKVCLPCVRVIR
jgi:hypothetical protein